jgi:hypothetical protein
MSYYKNFGLTQGYNDENLTILGAVAFLFFGSSRSMWNSLVVRIGFRKSFYSILVAMVMFELNIYFDTILH